MFRRLKRLLRSAAPEPAPRPVVRPPARPEPPPMPSVPAPDAPRELVLYKYDTCPFCRRVFQAADDLGLELPMRDTRQDAEAARELRALTGGTQVPCLVIDGVPLLESRDIIAWLEAYQSSGAASGAPSSSA